MVVLVVLCTLGVGVMINERDLGIITIARPSASMQAVLPVPCVVYVPHVPGVLVVPHVQAGVGL